MVGSGSMSPEVENLPVQDLVEDIGSSVSGVSENHFDIEVCRCFQFYEGDLNACLLKRWLEPRFFIY